MWLSEEALHTWRAAPSGKPGGQRRYTDIAIEAALAIRMVFHLPLRQTEGFLRSVAELLDVDLPIPDHTTPSRRLTPTLASRSSGFPRMERLGNDLFFAWTDASKPPRVRTARWNW